MPLSRIQAALLQRLWEVSRALTTHSLLALVRGIAHRSGNGSELESLRNSIKGIERVINYELPVVRENYIHRIGRSGRYGRKGASINLVNTREMRAQEEIEVFYGKKIEPLPLTLDIYYTQRLAFSLLIFF